MADCSDLLCVDELPSNQDITTPNSKTIHGEAIEGRQGFSQLRDTTASSEMPCMAKETYQNSHKNLSAVVKEVSWQKIQAAAAGGKEAALAIQEG
ncbi:hypothetical protein PR048_033128 [Dryococelus australis]|uniref:Uncharacterized protein n=1 Tax=Dryococelus australis TaxID=614101 RepID=A0ABQ9G0B9_9NEOP|nr:hypothetical protein PR048_033128 [Dryococelus australis]